MLTLPLEPTDDRAAPIFKDAVGCTQWLGQLQLTNLQQAHNLLLSQIKEINRYPMQGLERLKILELLRETVGYIQDDFAKKLIAKPLPLNESEHAVFNAIVNLWQAMVQGYQRGLQAYLAGDKQLAKHGALLCQRCLSYCGLVIFEHLRTGYEFDIKLWQHLHELYAFAEDKGLHQIDVPDPLSTQQTRSSCSNSYVKTLLACFARPAELTRWQLQQLDRWLSLWSNNVTIEKSLNASKNDAQPLAADLSSTQGLQRVEWLKHTGSMRYLAMVPLSKLLRVKTILLQQGQTSRQVGLGEQFDSGACIDFLVFLHQCWCENFHKRTGERKPIAQHAELCYRPEGIYAHLSGKPFKQPDKNAKIDTLTRKQIETFGHSLKEAKNHELVEMGYPLENWKMDNESIMGARLTRADRMGGRLNYKQLIALRPSDAQSFMLGTTAWANVSLHGELQIGIRYLPGLPEPVLVKGSTIHQTAPDKFAPAFFLPPLPALKTPASLILPRDWFLADRVIEVQFQTGTTANVQLGFSVERGMDYERVSFNIL